ncbi:coiled-coil domain-containing protein 117 isoform X4 [Eleginops maclovinus]
MYSFSGPTSYPEFDLGSPSTSDHLQRAPLSNSWETRCLRKHRRRVDDEGCSAKKRRLMFEAEVDVSENSNTSTHHDWTTASSRPPLPAQPSSPAPPKPCPASHNPTLSQPPSTLPRPEPESSCMEVEAAQRKLQEIEDRITLEDDDEDEDLNVEPAPRRPVLVMSDSLKEGLQRGISDILPHTVAQSVSQSCMELVLWRPPEDPFCRKRKVSLQKQHKKHTVSRLPPTPCPSPIPHIPLSPSSLPADTHSALYSFPVVHTFGEEDMEM